MSRFRAFRPVSVLATAVALTAVGVGVPSIAQAAPGTPAQAAAARSCEVWRSSGSALTGFARCTSFDGASKFQIRVTCAKGAYVWSPVVRMGQTTWASCTSAQGYVAETTIYGRN